MTHRSIHRYLSVAAALAVVSACTNDQLIDRGLTGVAPIDRQVQLQGKFCALGPNQVVSPIKILFVMDSSGSMRKSDPSGQRASAIANLIQTLPPDPNIYFAVMVFSGFDTRFFTKSGNAVFDPITTYSAADLDALVNKILIYQNTSATGPNSGNTDFVKPLDTGYQMLVDDIVKSENVPDAGIQFAPARYSIIFLSDGSPTQPQDPDIAQAITELVGLAPPPTPGQPLQNAANGLAESVTLNTVHVSPPAGSACNTNTDAGILGCAALLFQQDAQRLAHMASLGNGQFRDFANGESINYLSFGLGSIRRSYVVKELYAANFSALPESPIDQADSDSDGLSDWLEEDAGLDPRNPDTTHDGYSDGVKWYLNTHENAVNLDPHKFNVGCEAIHVDGDCDGIWDCDEHLLGSDFRSVDTDADGAPDGIEWRLGTQLATNDLGADPDSDGILNGVELRLHSNPLKADATALSQFGYRYELATDGPPDSTGVQCYDFTVSNVLLAPTLDLGRGEGFNDLYLAFSMVPADNPNAPTILRQTRYREARFPANDGGIKVPADGLITFQPSDFHDKCAPTDPPLWTDVP